MSYQILQFLQFLKHKHLHNFFKTLNTITENLKIKIDMRLKYLT